MSFHSLTKTESNGSYHYSPVRHLFKQYSLATHITWLLFLSLCRLINLHSLIGYITFFEHLVCTCVTFISRSPEKSQLTQMFTDAFGSRKEQNQKSNFLSPLEVTGVLVWEGPIFMPKYPNKSCVQLDHETQVE